MKINKKDLAQYLSGTPFQLIFGLGFDQRSLNVLELLEPLQPTKIIALTDSEIGRAVTDNLKRYQQIVGNNRCLVEASSHVLGIADKLSMLIRAFDNSARIIVDITAMTNEMLAILIAILREHQRLVDVTLCYTGATEYSYNSTTQEIWLSKGVSSIRSILGYPGEQLPSQPLHLVLMTGFEVERALETLARFEPAILSLGVGARDESISKKHYETNLAFTEKLEEFIAEQERSCATLTKFSFSCIDPRKTKQSLQEHLSAFSGQNLVICPLNTKLSTVGASLYCFEHPEVQLCYTQPMEYNLAGYARAGDTISVFSFKNEIL